MSARPQPDVTSEDETDRRRRQFFYCEGTPAAAQALLEDFVLREFPGLATELHSEDPARRGGASSRLTTHLVFFIRAAQGRPEILAAYNEVAQTLPSERVELVLRLMADAGGDEAIPMLRRHAERSTDPSLRAHIAELLRGPRGASSVLLRASAAPITDAQGLDLRWVEFFAAGDRSKIDEIIAVLDRPDRIRDYIRGVLWPRRWYSGFFGGRGPDAELVAALRRLGLRIDTDVDELLNREDVDLVVTLNGSEMDASRVRAFLEALPSRRTPDELIFHAVTKASAFWSLVANAVEHPPVLEACVAAAATRRGPARLSLHEIIARTHERREDLAAALQAWTVYAELNPSHAVARQRIDALTTALRHG